jgi:hypothetical protein
MRDHDPRRDREDHHPDHENLAKKGQNNGRVSDRFDRGHANNLAKNGDPSKHIGALGGKKDVHPAATNVGKDVMKGKAAPVFKDDRRPAVPSPADFKGRLPFGKGKGKG